MPKLFPIATFVKRKFHLASQAAEPKRRRKELYLVARHESNAVTSNAVPETDAAITRPRGDVI